MDASYPSSKRLSAAHCSRRHRGRRFRGLYFFLITSILATPLTTSSMDDPSAPPSDVDTDFTKGILILTIVPTTVSATVAGLRFATRAWIVKGLGWDDYAMMMAIVSAGSSM